LDEPMYPIFFCIFGNVYTKAPQQQCASDPFEKREMTHQTSGIIRESVKIKSNRPVKTAVVCKTAVKSWQTS
jgi:hypothetical protein